MTRQGIIPQGVKFWRIFYWLAGDSAKNQPKHDYPGYDTPASQAHQGIILRGVSLAGVSYSGESYNQMFHPISPESHTPASQARQGCIPRRVSLPGVCDSWPQGVKQPFLNTFAQAFKGTVAQK